MGSSTGLARYVELGVVIVGIYVCFLTWGLTQERVTTTPYDGQKFKYFIFLNVIQSLIASFVAYIYLIIRRQPTAFPSKQLTLQYFQLSITSVLASPFGYASLLYIDYPTMILGKSCKLIPPTGSQMMLYMNLFSSAIMAGYLFASNPFTGELSNALAFSSRHPSVLFDIILFGLCGALGQCFIYRSLESFGAIATVTITLTRKMMSIVLSVLVYNHELIWQQWMCVLVVFFGITLEAFWKDRKMPPQEEEVDLKNVTPTPSPKVDATKILTSEKKAQNIRKRK
ncbi:UAA transporter [Chytridium lagenaria]|nr:UAA transporter [Chytridium lagenaria]